MFYDRYVALCKENKVSPSRAAEDNGLSRTSVVKWKKGAVPSGATIQKLAGYFGVTSDYLIGNVNDPLFYLDNVRILKEINSCENEHIDQKEKSPALTKKDERSITEDSDDPDIRRIERARNNMSIKDRSRMMKMLELAFEDYFDDNFEGQGNDK